MWAAFLIHQTVVFVLAFLFLTSVRRLTGRTIHLGREPLGFIDGIALILLSIGVIFLTDWFYSRLKNKTAKPLGLTPSPLRILQLLFGLAIGFSFAIAPWVNSVLRGTAEIADRIEFHFAPSTIIRILLIAFSMLILQAIVEEIANRAFPLRLWEHRSLLFRLIVPAVFFALIHLADEPFNFERFGVLMLGGILQSLAYLLTENVWLASGLHAGANIASFSVSGLWHAGGIISLTGQTAIPGWTMSLILLVMFGSAFAVKQYRLKNEILNLPFPSAIPSENQSDKLIK